MYLICINLGLGRYAPSASVNTNQIHHSYVCYNYYLFDDTDGTVFWTDMYATQNYIYFIVLV